MTILVDYDPHDILPPSHREALYAAVDVLTDEFLDDVATLQDDDDFTNTSMVDYLPRKYLPHYTPLVARQFLVCLITVAWKLRSPGIYRLACVGEELALNALIERAEGLLDMDGQKADFDGF